MTREDTEALFAAWMLSPRLVIACVHDAARRAAAGSDPEEAAQDALRRYLEIASQGMRARRAAP